jgi:hypothetical protein
VSVLGGEVRRGGADPKTPRVEIRAELADERAKRLGATESRGAHRHRLAGRIGSSFVDRDFGAFNATSRLFLFFYDRIDLFRVVVVVRRRSSGRRVIRVVSEPSSQIYRARRRGIQDGDVERVRERSSENREPTVRRQRVRLKRFIRHLERRQSRDVRGVDQVVRRQAFIVDDIDVHVIRL